MNEDVEEICPGSCMFMFIYQFMNT